MLKEFKEFAMKGNVIDLAVGVVIGAAFQKIIDSLVNDIIMPLIAALIGTVDFSQLSFTLRGVSINYGNFITQVINFLIIAFSIFLAVKYVNKFNQATGNFAKKVGEKIIKKQDDEIVEVAETTETTEKDEAKKSAEDDSTVD